MSSSETAPSSALICDPAHVDASAQADLARAVRLFADRCAGRDGALAAFPSDQQITATEVMVTVTAMLKAVNVQVFELGMWQAWGGR